MSIQCILISSIFVFMIVPLVLSIYDSLYYFRNLKHRESKVDELVSKIYKKITNNPNKGELK